MNSNEEPGQPEFEDGSPDESLASVPPRPLSVRGDSRPGSGGFVIASLVAAGAGLLYLVSGAMTPCRGAIRSTRLQWQERMQQIESAERAAQINSEADIQPDAPGDVAQSD